MLAPSKMEEMLSLDVQISTQQCSGNSVCWAPFLQCRATVFPHMVCCQREPETVHYHRVSSSFNLIIKKYDLLK